MSRSISLNSRLSHDAEATDELEVVLLLLTHPDLDEPIRLSTDPTERLSVDPLAYGTRSTWQTDDDSPFLFVLASALLPDDQEDTPAASTITLEAVDNRIAEQLNSTIERATVDLAVVLASSPDQIEFESRGLKLIESSGNALEINLKLSRDPLTSEPWPAARMTRSRFPGLHK